MPPEIHDLFDVQIEDGTRAEPTVEGVIAFMRQASTDDSVLFGHSMNGSLMLAAAAEVPCRGVIAVTPATQLPPDGDVIKAYWESTAEPERKQRADAIRAEFETASDADKPMLYARYNNLRCYYDLEHPAADPSEWVVGADWVGPTMASGENFDWQGAFDAVRAPVLLALGDHDFLAPPPQWIKGPVRPGWTVELFRNAGHAVFEEQPEAFVAAVDRWLATI